MPASEFPIKITGDASELTTAAKEAKEQLDQASKSVEILGDLIGVKVPDSIKEMLASSELLGPALSEAFAPLTAITFGIELFEKLSDKIKEVTNDMAGWDASEQAMYADLVKNNEELVKFNQSLDIQKLHLKEIGKTGSERLTQQIENTDAATKEWTKELDAANDRLKYLQGSKERFSADVTHHFSETGACLRYTVFIDHRKKLGPIFAELEPFGSLSFRGRHAKHPITALSFQGAVALYARNFQEKSHANPFFRFCYGSEPAGAAGHLSQDVNHRVPAQAHVDRLCRA